MNYINWNLIIFTFLISLGLITLYSCYDDISVDPKLENELILIYPNGGEQLTAGDIDTIRIHNTEIYDSLNFFYTIDDGLNWISIDVIENLPGQYIWEIPIINSNEAKIRIIAYTDEEENIFESEAVFNININEGTLTNSLQIIQPEIGSVLVDPELIRISWKSLLPFERFAVYYSKYSDIIITYGNPDNKREYFSEWILLNENLVGNSDEFLWINPNLYSNKVRIKVIGFLGNIQHEVISENVFTVRSENLLNEERQYQEKLSVGNRWVFKITIDSYWLDSTYYLTKDVISTFVENEVRYYDIEEKKITDTISSSFLSVKDREHYYPSYILQNNDIFYTHYYSGENGTWGIYHYHSESREDFYEEVFSESQIVKEDYIYDSGSGISSEKIKRAKDIGVIYNKSGGEGYYTIMTLMGALIDGVVYGDTSMVGY